MEHSLLDLCMLTVQNRCINKGQSLIVAVLFFFLFFFELFFMFGILRLGAQRGFTELSLILLHLHGPELFIAGKMKSFSENEA